MCFVETFVVFVQCNVKETERRFVTLHTCLRTWTESNNDELPDCTSQWIFSDIYIDLIGLLSLAGMKAVCDGA